MVCANIVSSSGCQYHIVRVFLPLSLSLSLSVPLTPFPSPSLPPSLHLSPSWCVHEVLHYLNFLQI